MAAPSFLVYKIYTRSTYTASSGYYDHDIAVLELNATLSLSDYIMPACIDWSGKLQLHKKPFVSAMSPGWGINEQGNLNEELRFSSLLFVNLTRCHHLLRESEHKFLNYLTSDKWCAISQDGSLPDRGDSGGSLTFPRYNERTGEQTNYIYGLVSNKPTTSDIMGITDILFHMEWIKDIMISIIKSNDKGD